MSIAPYAWAESSSQTAQVLIIIPERSASASSQRPAASQPGELTAQPPLLKGTLTKTIREDNIRTVLYTYTETE